MQNLESVAQKMSELGAVQISRDHPTGREGVFQMITKDRGGEGGVP